MLAHAAEHGRGCPCSIAFADARYGSGNQIVIASDLFRCLELHTDHEPRRRSVSLFIRKGRKKREGKRQKIQDTLS